ncbi:hypothetical protein AAZX31_04G211100 [Glycine max]|uniref:Uncharacterized protein n=2 Tax=Glycine subgen. Soja TaxID=1462606 RepID=K7KLU0_SOYBN|nr:hypothetical protein JHK87_010972 [Glycine soja]KAH1112765.1 hypothetical protein GYH30_010827 [Glycine max]KAH1255605.1 hypothetical protein GmHk_04G011715 [Glycine max]KHN19546.1 hypothetical protein glysoja_027803 [Glycine soja]KRH64323.1 hypothetical protein GLYMA_04G230100v4 [Glycine max]
MAILRASKLMSFAALLAILLLLMSFELGSAAQPSFKLGRKLFQTGELPPTYGSYPGGGGYTPNP